jgi:hypothetical protein
MRSGKKPPADPAKAAKSVLDQVISGKTVDSGPEIAAQTDRLRPTFEKVVSEARGVTPKNPAAVELGRRGGEARKAALPAEERSRIAKDAARKRWGTEEK